MFQRSLVFIFAFLLIVQLFGNVPSSQAYAYETSSSTSCSSFSASGTTDAPYVTVSVYNGTTLFLDIFPVSNGVYSINVNFETQADGTYIYYHVWGNTSATDPWSSNGGAFVTIDEACSSSVSLYASVYTSSLALRCNAFAANGVTNAPYVGVQVQNSSGTIVYVGKFASYGGNFSINVSFTKQSGNLTYRVWASTTSSVTNYDGSPSSYVQTARCRK